MQFSNNNSGASKVRIGATYNNRVALAKELNSRNTPRYAMGGARGGMTVSPQGSISNFIQKAGDEFVRSNAESFGQVSNEYLNQTPIGMVAKPFFGTDVLANTVGQINSGFGESMRGEVTPMDIANVASFAPIPVGAAVRGGLLAARAGTKFLPTGLKGIKALDASAPNIMDRAGSMQAGPISSFIEKGIGSAFLEATPDAILSAPSVIDISKSDLPVEQKIALIAGVVGLAAAPGTAASIFERSKLKVSQGNIAKGQGTLTDKARVATYNTPYSASDRALFSETTMPAPAIAAATQGARAGAGTKWDMSLYENDLRYKRIIDNATSGKTNAEESQKAFEIWKKKREQQGLKNPNIVKQTWEQLELNSKTGSLSRSGNSSAKDSPNPPNKAQRFRETLEGNANMVVYDSREKKLYDMLVARGELIPGSQKTNARGEQIRNFQLERKELNEWFTKTFGISNPQRLQAMRERMYQALENIV